MPKLVRDKIPTIIRGKGEEPLYHIAEETEYWSALKTKLIEEAHEVIEDTNIPEELADLIEVMRAICVYKGISLEAVEKIRTKKYEERGGFEERIILESLKK